MDLKLNKKQQELFKIMVDSARADLDNNPRCFYKGYEKEISEFNRLVSGGKYSHESSGLRLQSVVKVELEQALIAFMTWKNEHSQHGLNEWAIKDYVKKFFKSNGKFSTQPKNVTPVVCAKGFKRPLFACIRCRFNRECKF